MCWSSAERGDGLYECLPTLGSQVYLYPLDFHDFFPGEQSLCRTADQQIGVYCLILNPSLPWSPSQLFYISVCIWPKTIFSKQKERLYVTPVYPQKPEKSTVSIHLLHDGCGSWRAASTEVRLLGGLMGRKRSVEVRHGTRRAPAACGCWTTIKPALWEACFILFSFCNTTTLPSLSLNAKAQF